MGFEGSDEGDTVDEEHVCRKGETGWTQLDEETRWQKANGWRRKKEKGRDRKGETEMDLEEERNTEAGERLIKHARTYPYGRGPPLPRTGPVPVVDIILHWGEDEALVKVLLDSGSTIPLLSLKLAESLSIPLAGRAQARRVDNFAGQAVLGAGKYYSYPLTLQCKSHYSIESFEVAPLSGDYDVILPDWWIQKHKPRYQEDQGTYQISFSEKQCKIHYTKNACANFSLEWDDSVLTDPSAGILGIVCASPTEEDLQEAIARVPKMFREYTTIMTSEAARVLPKHGPYDHAIDLEEGTTPPWGPIYTLNDTELEELRKWLKRMTEMGAVQPSKSSCSSPMLFVPKGHGRGLQLCVDYRGINKITIPNRYPLPNMDELRERVHGSK